MAGWWGSRAMKERLTLRWWRRSSCLPVAQRVLTRTLRAIARFESNIATRTMSGRSMLRPDMILVKSRVSLCPRPVALLELLAAAAGTRVVAPNPGVGVRRDRHTGWPGRRLGTGGRAGTDQPVRLRFGRGHRCRPARSTQRPRDRTPALAALSRRRSDLHLQLEPALGERGMQVVHEVHEHSVGLLLVLDQRVPLTPCAALNRSPPLLPVVQAGFPILIHDAEHLERPHLLSGAAAADRRPEA